MRPAPTSAPSAGPYSPSSSPPWRSSTCAARCNRKPRTACAEANKPRSGGVFSSRENANELRIVRPDPHHPGVLSRVLWAGVNMKRIFAVLVALLLWHSPASAEYYFWYNAVQGIGTNYNGWQAAIDGLMSYYGPVRGGAFEIRSLKEDVVTVTIRSNTGAFTYSGDIRRSGSGCSAEGAE